MPLGDFQNLFCYNFRQLAFPCQKFVLINGFTYFPSLMKLHGSGLVICQHFIHFIIIIPFTLLSQRHVG